MQATSEEIEQLRAGMAALDAQRSLLGDPVVDAALGPMREKLSALEANAQPEQQRKQATVLFADVSGFTALSELMDAEDVAAVMNDLWALVDGAIRKNGGHIDKHIGDAVMAVWGADAAREDDPERAVRTALAMQAAVDEFCGNHYVPLSLRIGVNTGPVLFGRVGTTGEFTAMGDAVNLASRLEHAAPAGSVLISHDTYRHVRGIFDVAAQVPIQVKGKAEEVQTYLVLRAKPRAFRLATRGVEGIETRMIGREGELTLLQSGYIDAVEASETRVVTIVGEAGVGKSRLLYEFDNWLELRPEEAFYFKGRATQNLQNVPYSLFRDLFAFRFQILDSDPTAVALDKFRAGMADVLEPERADVVGHWLGFDFSTSEAVRPLLGSADYGTIARVHLTRYFRALAENEPVVIMLEDIHWADDQSLDLAAYLAAAIPGAQLLMIAVTRPGFFERRPGWGEGEAAFRRISLTPLSRRASRILVDEILRLVDEIPEALRELIVDAAEGNPFYVEELVKMLIDQGVIERGAAAEWESEAMTIPAVPGRWRVRGDRLAGLKVPPTLTGLLQARLDGLPRPERELLQRAAVIGRVFWDDCVAELMQKEQEAIENTLAAVRGRELIFRRERSSFAHAGEYIFKHSLLRDVAYEMVLLKHRAEYHGRVARWLEAHATDRRDEYLGLIAEHYVQAGEGLKAAALLEQAGQEALQVGAYGPAAQALERALGLWEAEGRPDSRQMTGALVGLGEACRKLGNFPAAEAALERALVEARAAGDSAAEAETLVELAQAANLRGAYEQARSLTEAALPLGRSGGSRAVAITEWAAARQAWIAGDYEAAEAHAIEALRMARDKCEVGHEINALNMLGIVAVDRREMDKATQFFETSLSLARRANHLSFEARALSNLGDIAYKGGDYLAAQTYDRIALERFRELGEQGQLGIAVGNLAQADLKMGDVAAAWRGAREVLALGRTLGTLVDSVWGLNLSGQILHAEGKPARALALYGLALAHPALENQTRLEIEEEIARLGFPAAEVEIGLAAGSALDFDIVVDEILAGEW